MLPILAISAGCEAVAGVEDSNDAPLFFDLADVYSEEVERAVQDAYQRDYLMFGFSNWA